MRSDKASTKSINKHSLLQINPQAQLPVGNGQLCTVVVKHSWGCNVQLLTDDNVFPVAWSHLEPTGGRIVWDRIGNLVPGSVEEQTHHP